MGKSPSVQEMEQQNNEYHDYLKSLEKVISDKATAKMDAMETEITSFYGVENHNGKAWDNTPFVTGHNCDFMQETEWSMDNVKKIIEAIGTAVFGDGTPPASVKVNKTDDISKVLSKAAGLEVYILGKVFEVAAGIVESFGASTSITYSESMKNEPIGNGFRLFMVVANDAYKSKEFFEGKEIISYLYAYDIRFSIAEAQQEVNISMVQLYEDQIETFKDCIESLLAKIEKGDLTGIQYEAQVQIYNTLLEKAKKQLDDLRNG